jgi:hypothetical protein
VHQHDIARLDRRCRLRMRLETAKASCKRERGN